MPWPKTCPSMVRFFGNFLAVAGILLMINYFGGRYLFGRPLDLGIALGSGGIVLIGLVASAIAKCLVGLEERLNRIESARSPRAESGVPPLQLPI
jgi:hypothetical protein